METKNIEELKERNENGNGFYEDNNSSDVINLPLKILSHSLSFNKTESNKIIGNGVSIVLKNVSELYISKVEFEVIFYDVNKNIIDTVEDSIYDFKSNSTRSINIKTTKTDECGITNYEIKILKIDALMKPEAQGDKNIKILKHGFNEIIYGSAAGPVIFVEMVVRNICDKTIARAIFDIIFYDLSGNVLDTVRHREYDIKPKTSRSILVMNNKVEYLSIKSYGIKLLKSYTSEFERVQLRRHWVESVDTGQEFRGIVKNISDSPANVAIVVSLMDYKDEKIGSKVFLLNDITPGNIKDFRFIFNIPEGLKVKSHTISIADIAESC
ncbi:MAG: FxLYD domain-containing protein [Eubacteriales bacterium]